MLGTGWEELSGEEGEKGTWWGEGAPFLNSWIRTCFWWVLNRTLQHAGLSHEHHQLHWPVVWRLSIQRVTAFKLLRLRLGAILFILVGPH